MEFLSFLILVFILVILISMKGNVNDRFRRLEQELKDLQKTMSTTLPNLVAETKKADKPVAPSIPVVQPPVMERPGSVQEDTRLSEFEPIIKSKETEWVPQPNEEEEILMRLQNMGVAHDIESAPKAESPLPPQTPTIHPAKRPTFFERNPDLEKFIGENLVSKIGIGILVLAIAYFVKYAIDNNWIGPIGRVGIGLTFGGILTGVAHRLRKNYKAFSSVLVGGGLAIFYFTIALAHHQFHLFGQTAAFSIMVIITGFAVGLALLYDRQEVAVIALVGGFATPFILSDGSGNYKSLFIYLLILNIGLLVLAYNKAWRLLNLLAFIFTVIIFGAWLFALSPAENTATYLNGFLFATTFYLLFFAINIAHNIRENKKFIASDFGILLANTSLYFIAGLFCIYHMQAAQYKGLFSAGMGIFNLGASYILFKNRKTDINIVYLLIGITLTFVSLTAPLQLNGNFITIFWASEAVLLFWLFQKSKIRIIEFSSMIIYAIMLISLLMDWVNVYGNSTYKLAMITNKGFITTVYAACATYFLFILRSKTDAGEKTVLSSFVPSGTFFRSIAVVLLFIAGAFEIHHQVRYLYPAGFLHTLYLELYTIMFALTFLAITSKFNHLKISYKLQSILLTTCVLVYLLCIAQNFYIQEMTLNRELPAYHFNILHWAMAFLTLLAFYYLARIIRKNRNAISGNLNGITWVFCILVIIFLSIEFNHAVRSLFYTGSNSFSEIQRVYVKTVLPVLWGVSSFAFMWLGMHYKFRPLRIISLTLFSITLLKLFMFDIRNIPVAGKIAAFFSLGVILLIVSFMYQRLKKILIDDEQKSRV